MVGGRGERMTAIAWLSLGGSSLAALVALVLLSSGHVNAAAFIGIAGLLMVGVLAYFVLRLTGEHDRSEVQRAEAMRGMQLLESRFDALLRHAADVVVVLTTNGTCVYISPSAETVLGIRPDVAVGRPLDVLLGTAAPKVLEQMTSISSLPGLFSSLNIDFVQPDGTTKVISPDSPTSSTTSLSAASSYISPTSPRNTAMSRSSPNRPRPTRSPDSSIEPTSTRFCVSSGATISAAVETSRCSSPTSTVSRDVNDRCGHEAGDEVLREVARRIREAVRSHDIVVRFGGDEFVVVCPNADRAIADQVAQRIHAAVCQPIIVTNGVAAVGVSIGIAIGPQGFNDPDALMRYADELMYRMKQSKPSKSRR